MTINDKVVLDLTDDEDLKDYFSRKDASEECHMEVTATLDEASAEQAVLSIKKVTVKDYSKESEPTGAKKKFEMGEPVAEEEY
jgi:hypothetical protein